MTSIFKFSNIPKNPRFPYQRLLGSKTLGTKCNRTSMCNVLANHDQNLKSRFRLLEVCLFVKLESSELQDLLAKSTRLDQSNFM